PQRHFSAAVAGVGVVILFKTRRVAVGNRWPHDVTYGLNLFVLTKIERPVNGGSQTRTKVVRAKSVEPVYSGNGIALAQIVPGFADRVKIPDLVVGSRSRGAEILEQFKVRGNGNRMLESGARILPHFVFKEQRIGGLNAVFTFD